MGVQRSPSPTSKRREAERQMTSRGCAANFSGRHVSDLFQSVPATPEPSSVAMGEALYPKDARYRTIVADPPWAQPSGGDRSGEWNPGKPSALPYPTLTVPEICALPIRDLAERDSHLYLWTTNAYLHRAGGVAQAWGFYPTTVLTWCKRPRGLGPGGAFAITTEFVLFCRRGSLRAKRRVDSTWFYWPRGRHSSKPDAFFDLVESVSPGPYLELFSRRQRLGWDTWGDEALNHVDLSA